MKKGITSSVFATAALCFSCYVLFHTLTVERQVVFPCNVYGEIEMLQARIPILYRERIKSAYCDGLLSGINLPYRGN